MKATFATWIIVLTAVVALTGSSAFAAGGIQFGRSSGSSSTRSFAQPAVVRRPAPALRAPAARPAAEALKPGMPMRGNLPSGSAQGRRSAPPADLRPLPAREPRTAPTLVTNPRSQAGSTNNLDDIRTRLNNRLPGAAGDLVPAGGFVPGQRDLTVPIGGRRDFGTPPGFGGGQGASGGLAGNPITGNLPSRTDIPTTRLSVAQPQPENPPLTTGTVVGEEREPVAGNQGNAEEPPLGTGTVVGEEREPIAPVVGGEGESAEEEAGEPAAGVQDLVSVIDALSGLIGAVGSIAPPADGGGYAEPIDGGFEELPAEPAPAMEATDEADEAKEESESETDVELVNVKLVDAGSLEQQTGPRFRLFYKNDGTVEVAKFHITVAVDAGMELTAKAETVTVESVGLRAGQSQTIDVRLPVEVLKMGSKQGRPVPYKLLVAWLDSGEYFAESDEENNALILTRDKIPALEE